MRKLVPVIWVLAAVMLLTACASTTPYVVTGQTLKQAGLTFLETAKLYDTLYEQKKITAQQYNEWKAVGLKFQKAFPLAEQLWNSARVANDPILEKKSAEIISTLIVEITKFGAVAYQTLGK